MVKGSPLLKRYTEIAVAGKSPGLGKGAPDPVHGGLSSPICIVFRKGLF